MPKKNRSIEEAKPVEAEVETPVSEPVEVKPEPKAEAPKAPEAKADRKPAVPAEAVEPEPEVEPTYEDGKHTMLLNVEHNQTRYEKGKTYMLDADLVEHFAKNGWIK